MHCADVLLVNMWAKDVGREAGAGKPLLKTIFQVSTHTPCLAIAMSVCSVAMFVILFSHVRESL